ncbi:BZ3500_MvSof-1268-A1-R1_Chr7-1g09390 [Microbotryum saponariae]|uniref:BZ3500_MvSof-1268-A1-R1_Chr7-1g09390 protein n=1 Tax=Microbotryum saponariae TaxID=289078 RepID=A0A2X0LS53_9BASI|nr:BZ3501_MvSof-1269-A2-R1_Chr7-1g09095 [Microbotryum saponariae]SDA03347.1 BZ3500_MvSof-1268-A1-R1_Chr7-1g09390 [Microbotryum saponariae]
MALDSIIKRGHPIVFGLMVFFSFAEMIQTAVLVGSYNRKDDYPSSLLKGSTRFLLFTSLWTLFFGIAYIVGVVRSSSSFLFSIASHGAWLALTWLFWLAGSAAVTDGFRKLGDCGARRLGHCGQLQSAEAFGWINWILSTIALAAIVVVGARSARSGNGFGGALSA